MRTILFDIETGPLPAAELAAMQPEFEAPGNLKDPAKIAAAIEAKRQEWLDRAALDPLTGQVLAIGLIMDSETRIIADPEEGHMLGTFHDLLTESAHRLVGFACNSFDLRFVVARGWKHRLHFRRMFFEGRWPAKHITDLREEWQCGDRTAHGSLDSIARHLGVGSKTGDGKDFARLWAEDMEAALAYLRNDLELTRFVAERLGVIERQEGDELL